MLIDYEKELNAEQLKVVREGDGHCLVLAGAGSGKTRTLVYRVAYLLENGVPADQIMLLTFTNKASREMLSRIDSILGGAGKGLWGGTFHSLGNRLLRKNAHLIGYTPNFTILDSDDSQQLVKSVLADLNIKPDKYFPKADLIRDIISFAYNSQKPIDEVLQDRYRQIAPELTPTIQTINQNYQTKKHQLGLMDFDDLLTNWYLLMRNPEHGSRISGQYKYVLVDEYQDTNKIQGSVVSLIAQAHKNLLVVGDDAQSIYSFRAATVSNILDFPKQYAGAKVFKLETNYRSTPDILALANASIGNNPEQFTKDLKSVKSGLVKPVLMPVRDNYQQAEFVLERILELRQQGYSLNDMAILSRSTYQNIELELEINKRRIPYEVRGGMRFFEQAHIKDVLAHLRIFANPLDELSWKRVLGLQAGIGPTTAGKIWQTIAGLSGTLDHVVQALKEMVLPGRADDGFKNLLNQLTRIALAPTTSAKILSVLNGYEAHLKSSYENFQDRIEDLQSLANFAASYKTLEDFLSESALTEGFKGERAGGPVATDLGETLVLSTIHQAKGLEWKVVFVTGLAEGQFPHYRVYERPQELSEERRLFYVAVTRAQDELYLVYPVMSNGGNMGPKINRPSTFISELDEELFERRMAYEDPSASVILERGFRASVGAGDGGYSRADDPDSRVIRY